MTNAGPCARCDDTASTLLSSGNTANKPLHAGPRRVDIAVTASVSPAPAAMRPARSVGVSGAAAATAVLRGKKVWPKSVAASATPSAHGHDTGRRERMHAAVSHAAPP